MRNCYSKIICILVTLLAAGCGTAPQHSNTLIFGTDTKFAFDISSSAVDAGAPSVTLGYKRREAVWLPLLANEKMGEDAKPCRNETTDSDGHKSFTVEGCLYKGEDGQAKDTYSVLASFGADFDGDVDEAGAKSETGLAQYFATGIAAQKLAEAGGAQLVNTNAKPEPAPPTPPTFGEAYTLVKDCASPGGDFSRDKWNTIVYGSAVTNTKLHSSKNQSDFDNWLRNLRAGNNPDLILLAKSARTVCQT